MTATATATAVSVRTARQRRSAPRLDLLVGGVAGVTLTLWLIGGGLDQFGQPNGVWLVIGQLAGLAAALAALVGLVLASRPASVEPAVGLDRLWIWHRWAGITTVWALLVHVGASALAYSRGSQGGIPSTIWSLMRSQPWMVAAVVGAVVFALVAATSWRRIRNRLSYETWYFLHLTGYLAVLAGFGHQLTLGTDLAADSAAHVAMRWWWIALAAVAAVIVVWSRLGGLMRAGRATIVRTTVVAPDTVAIELRGYRRRPARAGQFFLLRVLNRDLWWQAHPISLSAPPFADRLRFTVKVLGDGSELIARSRPGTRVQLEGPYGAFTADRADGAPIALIGGGVGLAPLRAVLQDCMPAQRPVVVARVGSIREFPHLDEVRRLVEARNGRLFLVDGPRRRWNGGRPFDAAVIEAAIPDIALRHVFVCGPPSMESAVQRGLRRAGVPARQVHVERFGA